jgi:hypothetical protein
MKKLLLVSLFALCALVTFSQEPADIMDFVPVSPNAASLGKFGNIPVTRVPAIDIPLCTPEQDDIELPIDLSHHAGGIQSLSEAVKQLEN